jgi:hypothetical protein
MKAFPEIGAHERRTWLSATGRVSLWQRARTFDHLADTDDLKTCRARNRDQPREAFRCPRLVPLVIQAMKGENGPTLVREAVKLIDDDVKMPFADGPTPQPE